MNFQKISTLILTLVLIAPVGRAQQRLVILDEDGSGPADSNQMGMLVLLQAPDVQVLGITMVSGNAWRDEEVQHTLRMLELTGHSEVPVMPGAVFPLVRSERETNAAMPLTGKPVWLGAWGGREAAPNEGIAEVTRRHDQGPWYVPALPEGTPTMKASGEDAAHFMVRQVREHPGEVTIVALGPLTNIALALAIEPKLAEMTKGIVIMGGSINPQTKDPEFATSPNFEFNFWFDPEAAHNVLSAPWPRVDVTTVDISIKTMFTDEMFRQISNSKAPTAQYIAKFAKERYYLWDELTGCAWLDPSIVTSSLDVYMDVDLSHGPSYGRTLTWTKELKPEGVRRVRAQLDLDLQKFKMKFVELMSKDGKR